MRTALLLGVLLLAGCGRVKNETRDALNKGGELAGSAAGEVLEGVTSGVEETWAVEVALTEELKARGLALGQVQVQGDGEGRDNRVVVYCSTTSAITDTLHAKAFDKDGREMGRASLPVAFEAGGADHLVLQFQALTDLERKSRIVIE